MRLKKEQIARIAQLVVRRLEKADLSLEAPTAKIGEAIIRVLTKNFEMEDAIDRQARDTMEQYKSEINTGRVDPHKMFSMIKKQIAKEKNFIL